MSENVIRYWIEDSEEYPLFYHRNGEPEGIFADILAQIEERSGCRTERVMLNGDEPVGTADAIDMLACGQLDLAFGLPSEITYNMSDAVCASETVYDNALTALILPDSPQITAENIGNCYWGADSAVMPMLDGTAVDGHTLDFSVRNELIEALEAQDIYGAIVRRSAIDYDIFAGHEYRFREYEKFSIPYSECICMNSANTGLNELVNELCSEAVVREHTFSSSEYANIIMNTKRQNTVNGYLAFGGIAISVILAVMCTFLAARGRRRRRNDEARLMAMIADNPDKELFELDLTRQKIKAYSGFSVFKDAPAEIPSEVTLKELSELLGFDFVEHYATVRRAGATVYKNRFIIYVGGHKQYIAEDGRRIGHMLFFTMTNVSPGNK